MNKTSLTPSPPPVSSESFMTVLRLDSIRAPDVYRQTLREWLAQDQEAQESEHVDEIKAGARETVKSWVSCRLVTVGTIHFLFIAAASKSAGQAFLTRYQTSPVDVDAQGRAVCDIFHDLVCHNVRLECCRPNFLEQQNPMVFRPAFSFKHMNLLQTDMLVQLCTQEWYLASDQVAKVSEILLASASTSAPQQQQRSKAFLEWKAQAKRKRQQARQRQAQEKELRRQASSGALANGAAKCPRGDVKETEADESEKF